MPAFFALSALRKRKKDISVLPLRIYNLSKTARDEVLSQLAKIKGLAELRSKDLKIAESEASERDHAVTVIFDKEQGLYLGRRSKGTESMLFPLLKDTIIVPKLPSITVDSGAVKFVCNGANIMRPGITKIDGEAFAKSDFVLVKEQKYGKAIAIGATLLPKGELESTQKGPVIENLHYVGDKYWEALKEIEEAHH